MALPRRNSAIFFTIVIATALAGYVREMVIAAWFGAGSTIDAFFLASAIVQTINDLLFTSTLASSVIPLLAINETDSRAAARYDLVAMITLAVGLAATAAAAIIWLALPCILDLLSPRISESGREATLWLGYRLTWLMPLNALITLLSLVMVSRRRMAMATLPFLGQHIVFTLTIIISDPQYGPAALALACYTGPVLFLPLLIWQSWEGLSGRAPWPTWAQATRFWQMARPSLLSAGIGGSLGLVMAAHLLLRSFAADRGDGTVAALGYAFRIYEVPLSLIVSPVATFVFPMLAALYARGDMSAFSHLAWRMLTWGLVLTFAIAAVTWFGAEIVVDLLLRRGSFDAADSHMTAEALRGYAPVIVAEAGIILLFRIFHAMHRPHIPLAVGTGALVVLFVLLSLGRSLPFIFISLSISAAFALASVILVAALASTIGTMTPWTWATLSRWAAGAVAATAVAIVAQNGFPGGNSDLTAMLAIAAFLVVYLVSVATLLPPIRRQIGALYTRKRMTNDRSGTP